MWSNEPTILVPETFYLVSSMTQEAKSGSWQNKSYRKWKENNQREKSHRVAEVKV